MRRSSCRENAAILPLVSALVAAAMLVCAGGCIEKKRPDADASEADDCCDPDNDTKADTSNGVVLPAFTCPIPHTIDGRFTGWPAQKDCAEWDVKPLKGVYGDLYVHYGDQRLVLLNDWHLRIEDIPKDWYNLFTIATGGGTQQWEIRVYADDRIEVLRDGKPYKAHAKGAYGFSASPEHPQPHTIFELELTGVLPGPISISESDPGPGKWPTPEKALKKEPKSFVGVLTNNGVQGGTAADVPILVAIKPNSAVAGTKLVIDGSNLGDETGELYFGTTEVTVTTWADTVLFTEAPPGVGKFEVFARRADDVDSNKLVFMAPCVPSCKGKACGADGCGGTCGTCGGLDVCKGGTCVCVPDCNAKTCGDNGCGASCGDCKAGFICVGGACDKKPPNCKPKCTGKTCGPDGCGASCGSCTGKTICSGGACACVKSCEAKVCGPDGCGGQCGACGGGQVCINGVCSCTPSCTGKTCGPNGCGGSCGSCPDQQACLAYQCCKPQCTKQVDGKVIKLECGWDGCASSCGTCPKGKYCLAGSCVCEPQCDGKKCGPDGCGGSCGSCQLGQGCNNGVCTSTSG